MLGKYVCANNFWVFGISNKNTLGLIYCCHCEFGISYSLGRKHSTNPQRTLRRSRPCDVPGNPFVLGGPFGCRVVKEL